MFHVQSDFYNKNFFVGTAELNLELSQVRLQERKRGNEVALMLISSNRVEQQTLRQTSEQP